MSTFIYQTGSENSAAAYDGILRVTDGIATQVGVVMITDKDVMKRRADIGRSMALLLTMDVTFADLQEALTRQRAGSIPIGGR